MVVKQLFLKSLNFTYNSKSLEQTSSILRTYLILQLLSLKQLIDSQSIQDSSSKSISVPNVRGDFYIYIAGAKTHRDKNGKVMFCVVIWIWSSSLTYCNSNTSKVLVLKWLLGFMLVFRCQKVKWYALPKRFV